jgi:tRNA dimethylallyltransferase
MPSRTPLLCTLIAGPTGSGKSRLALALARELEPLGGATIINSDSMQVYQDLRILTARPSEDEEKMAPHRLYGVFTDRQICSAGRWRELAAQEIAAARKAGRLPIVVGGTGLYFQALTEGLAAIPDIPDAIRQRGRDRIVELGNVEFHDELADRDPVMASRVRSSDPQRMLRAWEVLEATGKSLVDWQSHGAKPKEEVAPIAKIVLLPSREYLYANCDLRFEKMIAEGALEEVSWLLSQANSRSHPLMKAVGVREITRHLQDDISLSEAIALGQQATRRYAKRQMTWARNRMADWQKFSAQDLESFFPEILSFIRQLILTR